MIGVLNGDENVLIKLAFDKQSHSKLANIEQLEPLQQLMIGNDDTMDDETSDTTLVVNLTDSWNVTSDFVRNSFQHIGTLSDKDDTFKESMANNLESLKVDVLTSHHLLPRYGSLMTEHCISPTHFTMKFMELNMGRAAAILKMHGYAKKTEDLDFTSLSDSLLKSNLECEIFDCADGNEHAKTRIGAYLMTDSVRNITIRAGSTASSFLNRLVDHRKAALLTNSIPKRSVLYSSYPSKRATIQNKSEGCCDARGSWNQIKTSMAVGWDKDKSEELKKLFVWDECIMKGLERNNAKLTMQKKQERMLVYLFETVLHLCLSPSENISSNPGHELFNGSFGR